MSLLDDLGSLGRRLAQGFLSLDDLVAGQGLASGSLGQAEGAGRLALGAAAASTNLAARSALLGVQAGAKTARAGAGSLRGWVPGIGLAEETAGRLDERATRAADGASRLVTWTVELVGGEAAAPRNPLTGEPWLTKGAPPGYGWTELAADSVGPWWDLAVLPVTASADALGAAADTDAGRAGVRTALAGADGLLALWPGAERVEVNGLDRTGLRDAYLALALARGWTRESAGESTRELARTRLDGSVQGAIAWAALPLGLLGVDSVEAWVRADGVEGSGDAGRPPALVALCERELGLPDPGSPEAGTESEPAPAVQLARDTAFEYSRKALGREPALARIERLFGRAARERIEGDVSLGREDSPGLLAEEPGAPTYRALRATIAGIGDREDLASLHHRSAARLHALERLTRHPWAYTPHHVDRRHHLLRAFTSLAAQELALDPAPTAETTQQRRATWRRFETWANEA